MLKKWLEKEYGENGKKYQWLQGFYNCKLAFPLYEYQKVKTIFDQNIILLSLSEANSQVFTEAYNAVEKAAANNFEPQITVFQDVNHAN